MVDVEEAVKMFKRIYPEDDVKVYSKKVVGDKVIIGAEMKDGFFYFIADIESRFPCISHSYDTLEEAERDCA
jgi:hypothetical protein